MLLVLALLFLLIPIAELYVIVQVAQGIGVGNALGLLVLISIVGAWLTKQAGLGVLRRLRGTIDSGRVPSREVVDGFLVLLAGALLLAPGFITDAFALLLLLPPTRALVRNALIRRFRAHARVYVAGGPTASGAFGWGPRGHGDVREAASWEAGEPGPRPEPERRHQTPPGEIEP